ncbi:MAG: LysM domain-containing protein [Lachnospiraceae bacterium]|nr:LysM domain-containing protein [Lachnospiraceae bacterium]
MIEIICSQEEKQTEMPWRPLPKNVRQIGDTKEKRRIYIEDFVVTYLTRLAKPDHVYARGAILLGDIYQTEEGTAVFICGAIEAANLELDMDDTIFNREIWAKLLEVRDRFFEGQAVVGWFLSRIGFSVEMNQKITKAHFKNFPGNHKILYMMDSLENEDAFYICENQQLVRQKGYYIYYEKNSAMREYMLAEKGEEKRQQETDEKQEQLRRDRKVVRNYRRVNHYGKQNKKQSIQIRFTRAASMLLIVGTLGYTFYQMRGDKWLQKGVGNSIAETMAGIYKESDDTEKTQVTTAVESAAVTNEEELESQKTADLTPNTSEQTSSSVTETESSDTTTGELEQSDTEEVSAQGKPLYYTVRQGDTLASISRKMYTTSQYASQIAQANNLENENKIFIGQKILIPSID